MNHCLRWPGMPIPYRYYLFISLISLIQSMWAIQVSAQSVDTEPLAVTSLCAGSQIDVTGFRTGPTGDFTVQLSNDGLTYTDIPSFFLLSSGRYEVTYRATVPTNTPAGSTYRIRVVSKSPDITGTPSPTILAVKAKPVAPTVDAITLDCQRRKADDLYTYIHIGITAGASATLYNSDLSVNGGGVFGENTPSNAYFQLSKPLGGTDNGYQYPINETTYFISQTINDCESDKTQTLVRTLYTPTGGPTPVNLFQSNWGKLSYCQGDKSYPLNVNGHSTAPENYQVLYSLQGDSFQTISTTTVPPIPDTSVPGSQTYKLALVPIDPNKGCPSPSNPDGPYLVVNVNARPGKPTVPATSISLCQSQSTVPLSATTTDANASLVWYGTNGNVTPTAPIPPTQNATTNPDGDVYYVSQTLNGCESPKVAISVFVQTLPIMSVLGTTTTNLGLEVPLRLTFSGAGPYHYKLSGGLTGTVAQDTTILVLATQTTVYQIIEVTNKCGTGGIGSNASATVTVLIPTIQTLPLPSTTLCAGASLTTNFSTTGTFNSGSVFKIQLAKVETDTTKISFVDAQGSLASNGQVIATIPGTIAAGSYWVRVIATNPKIPINGKVSTTTLTIRPLAVATLAGSQNIYAGQPASLSVVFSGDGPWTFAYRDSSATGLGTGVSVSTNANPHVFEVKPQKTTAYALTSVSNGCGTGSVAARGVVVTVSPLLGIDDQSLADAIEVYPIPTTATLTVRIRGLSLMQTAALEVTDLAGQITSRQETRQGTSSFVLDQHPAGIYILHIQVGDRRASKRIVKL